MQCKILFGAYPDGLREELQHWLDERNWAVTIRALAASGNEYGYCVSVFYDDTPGPQYYVLAVGARRHDDLEDQLNQCLSMAPAPGVPMVAMASGRMGHCAVLLWPGEAGQV